MNPKRFAESSCLKCHHDVVDLEASERFPDPPAPKLLAGYDLIRQNGCYGCHEINGFDGPNRRIGPDLRIEPNYSAAARRCWPRRSGRQREDAWPRRWCSIPTTTRLAHALLNRSAIPPPKPADGGNGRSRLPQQPKGPRSPSLAQAGRRAGRRGDAGQAAQGRPQSAARGRASWTTTSSIPGFAGRRISVPRRRCRSSSACGNIWTGNGAGRL